jgi:DNA-binding GntR family transcriptional regulator
MENRFDQATLKQISAPSRRSDIVYEAIRGAIIHRRIKKGEWLREIPIAEELGVSRTMVRDALTRLVTEGLAVEVPYKGVQAAGVTTAELEEVYTIRAKLESWAFELAIEHLTDQDIKKMRELLPKAMLDPSLKEFEKTRNANREFHWIAIRATERRHLIRMLEQIWDMLPSDLVYPELTQTEREQVAAVEMQAHTQILQAIEAKDRQRVSDLIVTHILNSLRYSAPVLEKNVDRIEELTTV